MRGFNLETWRGLNEHFALPISLAALLFTGLTYFSDRLDAAEQRAISQTVVWRSEPLVDAQGIRLVQPNEAVAVQRVEFEFPSMVREDNISQPPSAIEIRRGWIEAGMQLLLEGCAMPNMSTVVIGSIPVNITTHYSVAGRNRVARDTYVLHFTSSVGEHGVVATNIDSVAIVYPALASADELLRREGGGPCARSLPRAELPPEPAPTR